MIAPLEFETPEQLAASGSIADLYRWMAECTADRARALKIIDATTYEPTRRAYEADAAESLAVWQACRDELDRRNGWVKP